MTKYRQPWNRLRIAGRRCKLQILDPATAFELEPELVRTLGDTLSFAIAAPGEIVTSVLTHAAGGVSVVEAMRDPVMGTEMAVETLRILGLLMSACIESIPTSNTKWIRQMFGRMVLERFQVDGQLVEEIEDWHELGFGPMVKWQVMGAQMRQTFGPLWTRSPYDSGLRKKDYGIAMPKSVPIAVMWADSLAKLGSASSSAEILKEWTPVEMIDVVESAAFAAATEQRAMDEARAEEERARRGRGR